MRWSQVTTRADRRRYFIRKPFAWIVLFLSFLQGCSYAISRQLVSSADNTISFERLAENPNQFKGKIVILGGTIARTIQFNSEAKIEIIQRELDYWGRPKRINRSAGRFIVAVRGFLNPSLYAAGMDVTIAGEVVGEGRSLENTDRAYPLISAKELKPWPKERPIERPSWWDPLYDPGQQKPRI